MEPDIVGSIPNLLMKVELASHCKRQILDPNSRYGKSWILEKIKEYLVHKSQNQRDMALKIWQYFKILLRNPLQNTYILVGYSLNCGIQGLVDQASFLSHEVKT